MLYTRCGGPCPAPCGAVPPAPTQPAALWGAIIWVGGPPCPAAVPQAGAGAWGVCPGEKCLGQVSSLVVSQGRISDGHKTLRQMQVFHGPREGSVPWVRAAPPALPSGQPLLQGCACPRGGWGAVPGACPSSVVHQFVLELFMV